MHIRIRITPTNIFACTQALRTHKPYTVSVRAHTVHSQKKSKKQTQANSKKQTQANSKKQNAKNKKAKAKKKKNQNCSDAKHLYPVRGVGVPPLEVVRVGQVTTHLGWRGWRGMLIARVKV